jgi:hypothetical protein
VEEKDMRILTVFGLVVLLLVSGCVGVQPYPYASDAFGYQAAQQQYMPSQQVAPVGCIPPYYPVWNGCALPMYRPQYIAPMYDYPIFFPQAWFNFNFGKRSHHRGGENRRWR